MRTLSIPLLVLALVGCHRELVVLDPLTAEEVIELAHQGKPSAEIIQKIEKSHTVYIMDSEDVVKLHEAGVEAEVIDHMLETYRRDLERRAQAEARYYDPWYGPYPYYGYGAYPYPYGLGWGYSYCW